MSDSWLSDLDLKVPFKEICKDSDVGLSNVAYN